MKIPSLSIRSALTPIAAIVCGLTLSGCLSDDGPTADLIDGVFLDSAVQGLSYSTPTQSGVTDENGGFTADRGQMIEFSIGDLKLPAVLAKETMTPLDIFDSNNLNDTDVVNLARLLQSLDVDGNPENGIIISPEAAESASPLNFASATFDQDAANLVANSGSTNTALIDAGSALAHFQTTLNTSSGVTVGDCGSDHDLVGRSAELRTFFHRVAGTVTIKDNCTIEVTNFVYDGQGPRVFFYGAIDGDYSASTAFPMGQRLDGPTYNGETLTVELPAGRTLDDLNSISVWCADVNIDFGSAVF